MTKKERSFETQEELSFEDSIKKYLKDNLQITTSLDIHKESGKVSFEVSVLLGDEMISKDSSIDYI